jgi:tetratricopeptide (TPR) repeat protein
MPAGLETVDPMIAQLITQSAIAVQSAPNNGTAWANHASALLANAFYEESANAAEVALTLDSSLLHVRYRQSQVLWRLGRQEEAIAMLTEVLATEPSYDPGWRTLALWELESGNLDAADAAIEQAWALQPKRPGTLETLINIHLQQDRAAEAKQVLEPKLNQPNTPSHLYQLASQVYRQLGDLEGAQAAAARGTPPPNRWTDPWMNEILPLATGKRTLATNALAMLKQRGPKAALPLLRRAMNADPRNVTIRGAMASALTTTGQPKKAIELLEAMPSGLTPDIGYWVALANTSVMMFRLDQNDQWLADAAEAFQEAEALGAANGAFYRSMARLAQLRNRLDEYASHTLQSARLFMESGDNAAAMAMLTEGLGLVPNNQDMRAMYDRISNAP